jgi:rare lipoprotein A (peptidoglycan hydrolase)
MRITIKTSTASLALIAAAAWLAAATVSASADTGGASASAPSANSKVHTTGIATWFGPGFYGKQTACGQTLTPSVIGVANRTLPCGTLIMVSYEGRDLTVPVLDRGPYGSGGANWDLTAGAAQALDITATVRVGTHVVGSAPNTPTLGLPAGAQSEALAGGVVATAPIAATPPAVAAAPVAAG